MSITNKYEIIKTLGFSLASSHFPITPEYRNLDFDVNLDQLLPQAKIFLAKLRILLTDLQYKSTQANLRVSKNWLKTHCRQDFLALKQKTKMMKSSLDFGSLASFGLLENFEAKFVQMQDDLRTLDYTNKVKNHHKQANLTIGSQQKLEGKSFVVYKKSEIENFVARFLQNYDYFETLFGQNVTSILGVASFLELIWVEKELIANISKNLSKSRLGIEAMQVSFSRAILGKTDDKLVQNLASVNLEWKNAKAKIQQKTNLDIKIENIKLALNNLVTVKKMEQKLENGTTLEDEKRIKFNLTKDEFNWDKNMEFLVVEIGLSREEIKEEINARFRKTEIGELIYLADKDFDQVKQLEIELQDLKKEDRNKNSKLNCARSKSRIYQNMVSQKKALAVELGKLKGKKLNLEKAISIGKDLTHWGMWLGKEKLMVVPREQIDLLQWAETGKIEVKVLHTIILQTFLRLLFENKILGADILGNSKDPSSLAGIWQNKSYAKNTDSPEAGQIMDFVKLAVKECKEFGNSVFNFAMFDAKWNPNCKCFEDFEQDFNKIFYGWETKYLEEIPSFVTVFDLGGANTHSSNKDTHSNYWREFLQKKNGAKLSPIAKIFFRKGEQNPKNKELGRKPNRFEKDQWTLNLGLRFYSNANKKLENNNSGNKLEISQKTGEIDKDFENRVFNKFVEQEKATFEYKIGIDRGINQLASICVIDKEGQIVEAFDCSDKVVYKDQIVNCYEREILHKNGTTAIAKVTVPNYALEFRKLGNRAKLMRDLQEKTIFWNLWCKENKNNLFESFLDLSNQNYKISKKKEKLEKALKDSSKKFTVEKNKQRLKDLPVINFYLIGFVQEQYCKDTEWEVQKIHLESLVNLIQNWYEITQKNSKEERQEALDNFFLTNIPAIPKLSFIKNFVGVMVYLLSKYPAMIIWEDLKTLKDQNDQDIEKAHYQKELEKWCGVPVYALLESELAKKLSYLKLQTSYNQLVPKTILGINNFTKTDKKGDQEYGLFKYISPEYTSQICPKCNYRHKKNDNFRNKIDNSATCKKCGFSTKGDQKGLEAITDGDILASYNIAREVKVAETQVTENKLTRNSHNKRNLIK